MKKNKSKRQAIALAKLIAQRDKMIEDGSFNYPQNRTLVESVRCTIAILEKRINNG
jgi:hypothetical protein